MVLSGHRVYLSSIVRKGGTKGEEKRWRGEPHSRGRELGYHGCRHRVHPADLLVDHAIETRISLTLRRGGLAAFHILEHSRPV